ncbi:HAD family hydrolase [Actinomyces culturomici]|uniref:HAD family hydrolase n=1 Tax=Actinomyces culturomici TaxID=1926276 RepID=UPI000E1FE11F|nr:HAD family phosphatase [Actinomyces culturomici]
MPHHVLPAAVLWDMDGTLVDTEPTWDAMTGEVVHDLGGELTADDRVLLRGASTEATLEVIERCVPDLDPTTVFDEIERRLLIALHDDLVVMDGAIPLLEEFASRGVPQTIVTSSRAVVVERVMKVLGADFFTGFVADDSGVSLDRIDELTRIRITS